MAVIHSLTTRFTRDCRSTDSWLSLIGRRTDIAAIGGPWQHENDLLRAASFGSLSRYVPPFRNVDNVLDSRGLTSDGSQLRTQLTAALSPVMGACLGSPLMHLYCGNERTAEACYRAKTRSLGMTIRGGLCIPIMAATALLMMTALPSGLAIAQEQVAAR